MAKKKNNSANANAGDEEPVNGEEKNAGGGGKKKTEPFEVVLKTEIHCEGCASKLTKLARSFSGVESAKADMGSGKLTVAGRVDPAHLRQYLAQKTRKKVDVVSPQPKKEDKMKDDKTPENDEDKNKNKNKNKKKKKDDKKPQLTTAMIKMSLHCQGCIEKIHKIVSKTTGVQEMSVDNPKEVVVVRGTMDVKALVENLKERFKRNVEVLPPPKKDKEEVDNAGGGGGGKKKGGGGGDGRDEKENGSAGGMMTVGENRMDLMMQPGFAPGYGFMGQPIYGNGYMGQPVFGYGPDNGYQVPGYPAHMKFNDENPNACSVM